LPIFSDLRVVICFGDVDDSQRGVVAGRHVFLNELVDFHVVCFELRASVVPADDALASVHFFEHLKDHLFSEKAVFIP